MDQRRHESNFQKNYQTTCFVEEENDMRTSLGIPGLCQDKSVDGAFCPKPKISEGAFHKMFIIFIG